MDEIVGNKAAAAYVGVAPSTWRAYVARGQAPKPEGDRAVRGHALPVWQRATLDQWQATRPGQGRKRSAACTRVHDLTGAPSSGSSMI